MIARIRRYLAIRRAQQRLERMVEANRSSFDCEQYRRNRARALKRIPRVQVLGPHWSHKGRA